MFTYITKIPKSTGENIPVFPRSKKNYPLLLVLLLEIYSIAQILLIIDYKSLISIMLIISEDILFKHATANNVQYGSM